MIEYRILKNTYSNGYVTFKIEKKIWHSKRWVHITDRSTIELARDAIEYMKGQEILSSEEVE